MFKTVFIMLGEKCNFSCRYCLQHPIMTEQLANKINPDLAPYLRKLAENNRLHVMFYGGEPLLYFQNIVEIHQQLKDLNCSFGIISNGALLTDQMVRYIHDNNIGVSISNDGPDTELFRNKNVLEDARLLAKYHRLGANVSGVINAKNSDIRKLWCYWYEKGFDVERTNIDLIMDSGLTNKELTEFDWEQWESQMQDFTKKVVESMLTGRPTVEMYLSNQYFGKLARIIPGRSDEEISESCSTKCGVGISTLNVDLAGDCYLCHNSSQKIGTIYDSYEQLVENFKPYDIYNKSEKCQNCPVFELCNGGCILVPQEARDRYYCRMMQTYFGAFIKAYIEAANAMENKVEECEQSE